jgi:dihydrofolate reductase
VASGKEALVAIVIAGMTMSVDGYVADANGSASAVYTDLDDWRQTGHMKALIDTTGAVLMGRRAYEMGDPDSYVGNYEFQVPIFVLTHHPPETPPKQDEHLTFTFVTDGVDSAVEQAKAAAGEKAVQVVGGAGVVQQLLRAGLVDELHVDVMPVLLGEGLRLFENVDPERVKLEKKDVQEIGPRTSLEFRVVSR